MNRAIVIFGGLLLDRYFFVDRWPARGQDGFFEGEQTFVGGCAVNMAAAVLNLGGCPHIVSCVGQDKTGEMIRAYLTEHALSQELLCEADGSTGSCLVFSEPDGERTFLTNKGVEECFPETLAEKILRMSPGCVGVTGYYLLSQDSERIVDCLEKLHADGVTILFDPSPLVGEIDPEILARVLNISDVLTPNESELCVLGGEAAIAPLVRAGKILIRKEGAKGGTVYTERESFSYASVPCDAVDTTGAGDSFSGALLYGMSQQYPLKQAVALASKCAAKTVQIHGPHGFWKLEE